MGVSPRGPRNYGLERIPGPPPIGAEALRARARALAEQNAKLETMGTLDNVRQIGDHLQATGRLSPAAQDFIGRHRAPARTPQHRVESAVTGIWYRLRVLWHYMGWGVRP
jgi:hypothetical protein